MDFLSVLKEGYEKNEHLHLLIKYNHFHMGMKINNDLFFLQFNHGLCIISTETNVETYPSLEVTDKAVEDLSRGVLLSELIKRKDSIYFGTLRDQLLMESILYLSLTDLHDKLKKVLVIN